MVLKKVLGFATTTSFILLVMIAPTTAAATATASLQQQDNDNATTTIDEPNIPIEPPAEEEEEEPREPILPDNENNDTSGIDEPPIAEEPIGPANETGGGGEGNVTTTGNVATTTHTWINSVRTPEGKNIANGGSTISKVVTVDFQSTATDTGKGSHVDLKIDNGRYKAVASPKTITGLSVGKHTIYLKGVDKYGNEDPTPAKWTFTVTSGGAGGPETWINWVRATPNGVNIANGGSTSSSTVIIDFQGTVSGRGSHIDLKIDNGPYEPVASPHKIPGLSDGTHTIYLKAVDKDGKADPTPAKWRFTVR